ncbi:hypothetical protein [Pendulispora albinea]|uniref:Uncharacterized protein n=1 Tax=Pendulispora albinea TaxID=2741071 RepID=A0ABZ2LLN9_9BACT
MIDPPCVGNSFSGDEHHPVSCTQYYSYRLDRTIFEVGPTKDAGDGGPSRPVSVVHFDFKELDSDRAGYVELNFDDAPESRTYALNDPAIRSLYVRAPGAQLRVGEPAFLPPSDSPELEATAIGRIAFRNLPTREEIRETVKQNGGDPYVRLDGPQVRARFEIRLRPNDPALPEREILLER